MDAREVRRDAMNMALQLTYPLPVAGMSMSVSRARDADEVIAVANKIADFIDSGPKPTSA